MRLYPNAKINIGLNITGKRTDGYHNIETIFYPLSLSDELNVELMDVPLSDTPPVDYTFNTTGITLEANPESNLIIKAYRLLQQSFEIGSVDISLVKNIPFGAGLGGGSADAAFMLKALNDLFQLKLTHRELEGFAVRLGADCPVFINNQVVFAQGIGEVFSPVECSLKGYYLLLVKPDIFVSTPEAYASITPKVPENSLLNSITRPVSEWKELIDNDFELSVMRKHPEIGRIKHQLYDKGALYASMSGSGAAVYGIFDHYPSDLKGFENYFVHVELF